MGCVVSILKILSISLAISPVGEGGIALLVRMSCSACVAWCITYIKGISGIYWF